MDRRDWPFGSSPTQQSSLPTQPMLLSGAHKSSSAWFISSSLAPCSCLVQCLETGVLLSPPVRPRPKRGVDTALQQQSLRGQRLLSWRLDASLGGHAVCSGLYIGPESVLQMATRIASLCFHMNRISLPILLNPFTCHFKECNCPGKSSLS